MSGVPEHMYVYICGCLWELGHLGIEGPLPAFRNSSKSHEPNKHAEGIKPLS